MRPNSFEDWLRQRAQARVVPTHQDRLQLAASEQSQTLAPIIHQSVEPASYLPQPQAPSYAPPMSHERILTRQQPHKQQPGNVNPNITSLYLSAVTLPTIGAH